MPVTGTAHAGLISRGYADTAAGQLHYRRVDGAGPPVVLLHRTPASSACFEPMLLRLAGRRAAIAFDTPGFGASFSPPGLPAAADYARWFMAAARALRLPQVHLCAHHTGTHFAIEWALLAPATVRSLLLSGVLHASADERAQMRQQIGAALRPDAAGAYLHTTWSVLRSLDERFDAALAHAELLGALTAIDGRDQAFGAILSQDFAQRLAQLMAQRLCPVRIAQAEDDPLAGLLPRVRAAHPGLTVELMGPAGMAAPERQPAAYVHAVLAWAAANDPVAHPAIDSARDVVTDFATDAAADLVNDPVNNLVNDPATHPATGPAIDPSPPPAPAPPRGLP